MKKMRQEKWKIRINRRNKRERKKCQTEATTLPFEQRFSILMFKIDKDMHMCRKPVSKHGFENG